MYYYWIIKCSRNTAYPRKRFAYQRYLYVCFWIYTTLIIAIRNLNYWASNLRAHMVVVVQPPLSPPGGVGRWGHAPTQLSPPRPLSPPTILGWPAGIKKYNSIPPAFGRNSYWRTVKYGYRAAILFYVDNFGNGLYIKTSLRTRITFVVWL